MRVAFVGKGGVGKSAIAGTFARALARRGEPVLAIDSDPLPGLAFSLGLARSDAPIPDEAVEEKPEGQEGPRWRLREGLSAAEAVESYAATAPDGVRFLQFGKHRGDSRQLWRSQFAFRQIVRELPADRWNLVGDLPGGTRQPFTGWGNFAELVLVVVEPTAQSLLTGRRLARLATAADRNWRIVAVANKVREPGDDERIAVRTGLEVIGSIPWDEALAEAEQREAAPIDMAPGSPGVRAVESLVERLCRAQSAMAATAADREGVA
ncbi:MAG: ArsA-related P-loop ATPase [Acidimicrobiales bacterium]